MTMAQAVDAIKTANTIDAIAKVLQNCGKIKDMTEVYRAVTGESFGGRTVGMKKNDVSYNMAFLIVRRRENDAFRKLTVTEKCAKLLEMREYDPQRYVYICELSELRELAQILGVNVEEDDGEDSIEMKLNYQDAIIEELITHSFKEGTTTPQTEAPFSPFDPKEEKRITKLEELNMALEGQTERTEIEAILNRATVATLKQYVKSECFDCTGYHMWKKADFVETIAVALMEDIATATGNSMDILESDTPDIVPDSIHQESGLTGTVKFELGKTYAGTCYSGEDTVAKVVAIKDSYNNGVVEIRTIFLESVKDDKRIYSVARAYSVNGVETGVWGAIPHCEFSADKLADDIEPYAYPKMKPEMSFVVGEDYRLMNFRDEKCTATIIGRTEDTVSFICEELFPHGGALDCDVTTVPIGVTEGSFNTEYFRIANLGECDSANDLPYYPPYHADRALMKLGAIYVSAHRGQFKGMSTAMKMKYLWATADLYHSQSRHEDDCGFYDLFFQCTKKEMEEIARISGVKIPASVYANKVSLDIHLGWYVDVKVFGVDTALAEIDYVKDADYWSDTPEKAYCNPASRIDLLEGEIEKYKDGELTADEITEIVKYAPLDVLRTYARMNGIAPLMDTNEREGLRRGIMRDIFLNGEVISVERKTLIEAGILNRYAEICSKQRAIRTGLKIFRKGIRERAEKGLESEDLVYGIKVTEEEYRRLRLEGFSLRRKLLEVMCAEEIAYGCRMYELKCCEMQRRHSGK